jgi:ribonuclease G
LDILVEEMDGGLWVAAVKGGRLEGIEIDPGEENVRWGAIYWAKVARIDKSIDAAFVLLDGEHEGVLNNADVRLKDKDGKILKGGSHSIAKSLEPGQMVAVQAKTGYFRQPGYEFMRDAKLPKVSMDVTLPGRFLIYAPTMEGNQVSSRIRDRKLRDNLLHMMDGFAPLKGLILRSSSEDTQRDVLLREAKILEKNWQKIESFFTGNKPLLVMDGPDAFQRALADQAGKSIDRIEIAAANRRKQMEEWCAVFAPDIVTKIRLVEIKKTRLDLALFDDRDILDSIENLCRDYALLPGGGSIIVQETAALTAIDVNRGADHRPVLAVNEEAAKEIARQLRLRNIGGIVVVDFLKLAGKAEQEKFLKALEAAFDTDPCTVQIHGFTSLGLVEITRKKRTPSLSERLENIDGIFD